MTLDITPLLAPFFWLALAVLAAGTAAFVAAARRRRAPAGRSTAVPFPASASRAMPERDAAESERSPARASPRRVA